MRTFASFLLLFICLTAFASAQGMMRFYRMSYGVSGWYSNGSADLDISQSGSRTPLTDIDREHLWISTRNGFFIARNLLLGVEFNWTQSSSTGRPEPNPTGFRSEVFERRLFFGPLLRWYQPMSVRWFVYPEISAGYSHFLHEQEETDIINITLPATISARGFALHAGAGMGYFLTRHVVFDATLRYMHAWRDGDYEVPGLQDRDTDMTEYDIQLLLGFQILI